jgi:predicted RNase H-like HicB family nuclease
MDSRKYRIVMRFDSEKDKFIANVPELPGCDVEGDSWEELTQTLDEAVKSKLKTIEYPPTPLDEHEWSGKLELNISKSLHRELEFLSKNDEITPEELAMELISEGLGRRYGGHRYYRSSKKREYNKGGGNNHNQGGYNQRRRGMSNEKYNNIMEDKAHFLEYVRNLEK